MAHAAQDEFRASPRRRTFVAIYVVSLIALLAVNHWFWQNWYITVGSWETRDVHAILIGVIVAAPVLFVAAIGTSNLSRRISSTRLFLVSILPAYALATLFWGALVAAGEMLQISVLMNNEPPISGVIFASGVICVVVFFLVGRKPDRFHVVRRFGWILVEIAILEIAFATISRIVVAMHAGRPNQSFAGPRAGGGLVAGFNVLLAVIAPMLIFELKRRRYDAERASRTPTCDRCGYDLRASVGRCPECGMKFTSSAAAT